MSEVAIRAEGLGKRYRLGTAARYRSLRDVLQQALTAPFRRRPETAAAEHIWALRDVSFEVAHGEAIGIIGRNGAGKSTLLKVLSRITEPTEGVATVHGRVGTLLEVGTGFHPELTARENIYLSAAILGMSRQEIRRRFDEIVGFAEVEQFLDTPVKHFSSGMYMRLAFSVASHLDPEILVIDEVLAVGDAAFQKKCLGRMSEVSRAGRTVLFVSHNMASIQALTTRCLWLAGGRVIDQGPTGEVVARYTYSITSASDAATADLTGAECRRGGWKATQGDLRFTAVALMAKDERLTGVFFERDPIVIDLTIEVRRPRQRFQARCYIQNLEGMKLATCTSGMVDVDLDEGLYRTRCTIDPNMFRPGFYSIGLYLKSGLPQDIIPQAITFQIVPNPSEDDDNDYIGDVGVVRIDDRWTTPARVDEGAR
jgi:lipopolysaccharide transport system ATP-binding protein